MSVSQQLGCGGVLTLTSDINLPFQDTSPKISHLTDGLSLFQLQNTNQMTLFWALKPFKVDFFFRCLGSIPDFANPDFREARKSPVFEVKTSAF